MGTHWKCGDAGFHEGRGYNNKSRVTQLTKPEMSVMSLTPGRNAVPIGAVEERRSKAVSLRIAGLSMQSVLAEINKLEASRHWGVISLRTLERDIAAYFRDELNRLPREDRDHIERQRDCLLAQMDNVIEEVAITIME